LAYVVLVLPYCYRAIDAGLGAIDVKTLTEAARSLGASWFTVMWRVIVPNISNAILNATLLSVALVLGEYTIANNLLYNNLQVELVHLARDNAGVSIAVAVAALLFAFALLVVLAFVGGRPRRVHDEPATALAGPRSASRLPPACRRTAATAGWSSRRTRSSRTWSPGRTSRSACRCGTSVWTNARSAPSTCSSSSASAGSPTATPARCRAASSS